MRIARNATGIPPFKVIEMAVEDFLNFKLLSSGLKNFTKDNNGSILNWKCLRCMKFVGSAPHSMFYKHDYGDEYTEIDLMKRVKH